MRITHVHVEHFGILQDVAFTVPERGALVVLGRNEAGKSTLLAFLRAMLFGIPRSRSKDERTYPMADHRIGALGLDTRSRGQLRLERSRGPHGGPIRLTDTDGIERPKELLRELLGGVDRDIYRTIYGFSLDELQDIQTVTGDSVANAFHAASLGTDRRALLHARTTLDKRLDQLFKPNGRTQEAAELLSQLEDVEKELREHEGELERFHQMHRDRAERAAERDELKSTVDRLSTRMAEIQKVTDVWEQWVKLRQVESQLAELPVVPEEFPDDGTARLDGLREAANSIQQDSRAAKQELERIEQDIGQLDAEQRLAPHAAAIQALERRTEGLQQARTEIATLNERIQQDEKLLAEHLPAVMPNCTVEHLHGIDRSQHAHQRLCAFRDDVAEAQAAVQEARQEAARTRRQLEDHEQGLRETENEIRARLADVLPQAPAADADLARELTVAARMPGLLRQLEARRATKPSPLAHLDAATARGAFRGAAGMSALLLLATLLLAAAKQTVWGAAAFVGMVLGACCAAVLWVLGRSSTDLPGRGEGSDLRDELNAVLGPDAEMRWTAAELEPRVRRMETVVETWRSEQRRTPRMRKELEQATLREAEATATLEAKLATLRNWLPDHGLPEQASAQEALDMLAGAERAAQVRDRLDEARRQRRRHQHRVDDVESELANLRPLIPQTQAEQASEVQIQYLANALQEELKRGERRRELQREKRRLEDQIEEFDHRLQQNEQARQQLLALGGGDSEETFRRLDHIRRQRIELDQERRLQEGAIQALYGPDRLPRAREILAAADPDALREETEKTGASLQTATEQLRQLDETIGELKNQIDNLATDAAVARLKARRAALRTRLHHVSRQWLVCRTAKHLIAEARRRFEEERQPEVVRAASEFLQTFTEGRYTRIIAELEDARALAVLSRTGDRVPTEALSRGTAEQLYLALRLGYIAATRRGAEELPVIMDDILVNFDPERQAAAAAAIAKFAEGTQVLYFTCHPDVSGLFSETAADGTVYQLAGGNIAECKDNNATVDDEVSRP